MPSVGAARIMTFPANLNRGALIGRNVVAATEHEMKRKHIVLRRSYPARRHAVPQDSVHGLEERRDDGSAGKTRLSIENLEDVEVAEIGRDPQAAVAAMTCSASRSALEYTATVSIPIRRAVLMTRQAISPRFAIRILWNMVTVANCRVFLRVFRPSYPSASRALERSASLSNAA